MAGGGGGSLWDWFSSKDAGSTAANNTGYWGNQQANTQGNWNYLTEQGKAAAAYQGLLQQLANQKDIAHYGADQTLAGIKYGSDNTLKGQQYMADQNLAGTKYGADQNLAGIKYGSDSTLAGVKDTNLANTNIANIGIAPAMYKNETSRNYGLPMVGNLVSSMFGISNPTQGMDFSQKAVSPVPVNAPAQAAATPAPAAPVATAPSQPAYQRPSVDWNSVRRNIQKVQGGWSPPAKQVSAASSGGQMKLL